MAITQINATIPMIKPVFTFLLINPTSNFKCPFSFYHKHIYLYNKRIIFWDFTFIKLQYEL